MRIVAAFCGMALLLPACALAQTAPAPSPRAEEAAGEKARREEALREVEARAAASREAERRLAAEMAGLQQDRTRLAAALVETGARTRAAEERMRAIEERLEGLAAREETLRRSLAGRDAVLAEVLAALQRMNRRDGPAILIRADDILAAIRSSMVLGAVLPGLRSEVGAVAADLSELVRIRQRSAAERGALKAEASNLAGETRRLAALTALRQEQLSAVETDLGSERSRSATLGREARSLKELVDRLEAEIDEARKAADEARRQAQAEIRRVRDRFAAAASKEPARLAPKMPFAEARGLVARPAAGLVRRDFGAPDGQGGTSRGIVIASRPGAVVTAPSDGWVAYAGPFRSYGRLLIINAGGGYYLLLAGLGGIGVEIGQFVLAGEPVGQMGEAASASAASGDVEAGEAGLYVEFRKDGGPIDPSPWWVKSSGEKARG